MSWSVIKDLIRRRDAAMERAVQASINLQDPFGKSPEVEAIMQTVAMLDRRILRLRQPLALRSPANKAL